MIVKEKNLLKFITREGTLVGEIDINNGNIYGKTGKKVCRCNPDMCHVYRETKKHNITDIPQILKFFSIWDEGLNTVWLRARGKLLAVDRLISLKLPEKAFPLDNDVCLTNKKKFDSMISNKLFMGEVFKGKYRFSTYDFERWEVDTFINEQFQFYPQLTKDEKAALGEVFRRCEKNNKYLHYILKYLFFNESIHMELNWYEDNILCGNHQWEAKTEYDICNLWERRLTCYYWMTKRTHREWAKKDWPIDYYYTTMAYHSHSIATADERFSEHVDPSILKFEFGRFEVICPTCGNDLIEEGRKMHHCVGSYVARVMSGACSIVFIRKKEDRLTPYITCEILGDGSINQYYKEFDTCITSQEDREFRAAYQEYLDLHCDEIKEMLNRG